MDATILIWCGRLFHHFGNATVSSIQHFFVSFAVPVANCLFNSLTAPQGVTSLDALCCSSTSITILTFALSLQQRRSDAEISLKPHGTGATYSWELIATSCTKIQSDCFPLSPWLFLSCIVWIGTVWSRDYFFDGVLAPFFRFSLRPHCTDTNRWATAANYDNVLMAPFTISDPSTASPL